MHSSLASLVLPAVLLCLTAKTRAFKYDIDDKYVETGKWSFTETYMYGSHKVGEKPCLARRTEDLECCRV